MTASSDGAFRTAAPAPETGPQAALTCPKCKAAATPSASVLHCASCGLAFTLRAGPRADGQAIPPPYDPRRSRLVVKWAGTVLMQRGELEPQGVKAGALDPIIAVVPLDASGVLYPDIVSVAVWRKMDWLRLVIALLVPVPLALGLLALAVARQSGVALVFSLPFAAAAAWLIYTGAVVRANWIRVTGSARTVTIRFDRPIWRRRRFHDELLYRAGITPSPIP